MGVAVLQGMGLPLHEHRQRLVEGRPSTRSIHVVRMRENPTHRAVMRRRNKMVQHSHCITLFRTVLQRRQRPTPSPNTWRCCGDGGARWVVHLAEAFIVSYHQAPRPNVWQRQPLSARITGSVTSIGDACRL